MKFDRSQFDNLELENIGQWPAAAKLLAGVFLGIVMLGLGYYLFINDRLQTLDNSYNEEITLKQSYQSKYHVAANLELFQAQMAEAETLFANQLKSLPESHETPGLIDDITFVGTTSGLEFVTINWQPEIVREIYIELPIDIQVIGTYHEFGHFVSKIASLPRIVTLHDFEIKMVQDSDNLRLELQAKTYRYNGAKQ
jgi:type IV pilus assembly protein PilO